MKEDQQATAQPRVVLRRLVESKEQFDEISFSPAQGIYAYFLNDSSLPLSEKSPANESLLYIGKTLSGSEKRNLAEHFKSGATGHSTFRRSIGALLRKELRLQPVPRSRTEKSQRRFSHFMFEEDGEERLTKWMRSNLALSFYVCDASLLGSLELALIDLAVPPLNMRDNPRSASARKLRRVRKICADIARDAASRGSVADQVSSGAGE